jgi:S1-C subfamily serine protease
MRPVLAGFMACVLAAASPARAQTSEDRALARDLVTKRGDAVILVLATLKTRTTVGGRENSQDRPMQANATVLDGSGLTVMALSMIEPNQAVVQRLGGPGAQIQTETAELRLRLADGRELPARVVLRDADLDLAFLRPVEPLPSPIPALDTALGKPGLMDLVVILSRTGEATSYRPIASFGYVQMTVEKPRMYHAVIGGNTLGAAVFDGAGRFVGVFLAVGGARSSPFAAVLPADDIREIAKQATSKF